MGYTTAIIYNEDVDVIPSDLGTIAVEPRNINKALSVRFGSRDT